VADVFLDDDLLKILNLLLYGHEERPPEAKIGFWKRLFHRDRLIGRPVPEAPPVSRSIEVQASVAVPVSGRVRAVADVADIIPVHKRRKPGAALEIKKVVRPSGLPSDPDALRKLLARHLEMIDLLVLDPRDMAQLLRSREVSETVKHYVDAGGSLFAFVAEPGDYREVVGAPLTLASKSHKTKSFELFPGDVANLIPAFEKKVKVKSRRPLPELGDFTPGKDWRVLAFTEGRTEPRLLELGKRETGGYVALWLDDPESFYGPLGGTVPQVEETRGKVEARIFEWAHYLMYRRYDKSGERARPAAAALLH
jgi:hypothetical protein